MNVPGSSNVTDAVASAIDRAGVEVPRARRGVGLVVGVGPRHGAADGDRDLGRTEREVGDLDRRFHRSIGAGAGAAVSIATVSGVVMSGAIVSVVATVASVTVLR